MIARFFFSLFICLSCCLEASFSTPVDVPSLGFASSPRVSIDSSGNAVIVFADVPDAEFQVGATLVIDGVTQAPTYFPLSVNIVQANSPNVSVNSQGNAIAAWWERNSSFERQTVVSYLINGVWSLPQILTNITTEFVSSYSFPGVALDDTGNGLVVWAQSTSGNDEIQWSRLVNLTWQPAQTIFSSSDFLATPALSSSGSGAAIAAWYNFSQSIVEAAVFDGNSWSTTSFPTSNVANTCGLPQLALSMNTSGNAVIAWMNDNSPNFEIQTVRLTNGVFGPQEVISDANQGSVYFQGAALDNLGNGFVIWTISEDDTFTTSIQVARLSNGTWGTPLTIDGPYDLFTVFLQDPEVVVDGEGNALATWSLNTSTERKAMAATYSVLTNSWSLPFLLSNIGQNIQSPQPDVNSRGQAIVTWSEGNSSPDQQIQFVIGRISPLSPSNFSGKRIANAFSTQTDYVNRLTWTPSSDTTVTGYLLYRNGQLIAVIPAGGPFAYDDHHRKKKQKDVYTLTSVDSGGIESSPPLEVTLP